MPIRHSRISEDKVDLREVQNRNWQYLINYLIEKVERVVNFLKIKTKNDSQLITAMEKRLSRAKARAKAHARRNLYKCRRKF